MGTSKEFDFEGDGASAHIAATVEKMVRGIVDIDAEFKRDIYRTLGLYFAGRAHEMGNVIDDGKEDVGHVDMLGLE